MHNECDNAATAQKTVYVLTLGPLNLATSRAFGIKFILFLFFYNYFICIDLKNNIMCPYFQIKREIIQTSVATKMHDKIERV